MGEAETRAGSVCRRHCGLRSRLPTQLVTASNSHSHPPVTTPTLPYTRNINTIRSLLFFTNHTTPFSNRSASSTLVNLRDGAREAAIHTYKEDVLSPELDSSSFLPVGQAFPILTECSAADGQQITNTRLPRLSRPLHLRDILSQPTLRVLLATSVYSRRRTIRFSYAMVRSAPHARHCRVRPQWDHIVAGHYVRNCGSVRASCKSDSSGIN